MVKLNTKKSPIHKKLLGNGLFKRLKSQRSHYARLCSGPSSLNSSQTSLPDESIQTSSTSVDQALTLNVIKKKTLNKFNIILKKKVEW